MQCDLYPWDKSGSFALHKALSIARFWEERRATRSQSQHLRPQRLPVLNNQGRALIDPIQEIISRYESLGVQFKSGLSGSLTLGALVSSLMGQFGKTLEQLKQQYPELEIKISTGLSSAFSERLKPKPGPSGGVSLPALNFGYSLNSVSNQGIYSTEVT